MQSDDKEANDRESRPSDEPQTETARKTPSEEIPEWLVDWSEPDTRPFQFGLISLFGLMTACAVYVALEKAHGGRFGVHLLSGMALFLGVALPAFWFSGWFVRAVIDRGVSLVMVVLAVPLVALFVYCLLRFFGG